jgi:hypothetical protein
VGAALSDDEAYDFAELGRRAGEVAERWAALLEAPVALDRVAELPPGARAGRRRWEWWWRRRLLLRTRR